MERFIIDKKVDILHLQEARIEDGTFETCRYISSNFNVVVNNSQNNFGTASLVKNDLEVTNIGMDTEGRVIVFDVSGAITCGNFYLPSGTDRVSKGRREEYSAEIIPQLLIHHRDAGIVGGDFNSITHKRDATKNPAVKMSPSLLALVSAFGWTDSFRHLHPAATTYSRYYSMERFGDGATRIDRCYHWGGVRVVSATYHSIAFSDHMAQLLVYELPGTMDRILAPRSRPLFKVHPSVVSDTEFRGRMAAAMADWQPVRDLGVDVRVWWEHLVKPGFRRLAMERGKEMNKHRRAELNMLLMRQNYLTRKLHMGNTARLTDLREVHILIESWYKEECKKISIQSHIDDMETTTRCTRNPSRNRTS